MGQAWCKEKSSKAQDSKSPLDRVFVRCAHRIYPSLKEEGSVLGGATQRVTSSEIGYAGSPPRAALLRGQSIDSVDRPFHPSEWVDVNLEVPCTPRASVVLTNLSGHQRTGSSQPKSTGQRSPADTRTAAAAAAATASMTTTTTGGAPVPPPRRRRRRERRPLPPKPGAGVAADDESEPEPLYSKLASPRPVSSQPAANCSSATTIDDSDEEFVAIERVLQKRSLEDVSALGRGPTVTSTSTTTTRPKNHSSTSLPNVAELLGGSADERPLTASTTTTTIWEEAMRPPRHVKTASLPRDASLFAPQTPERIFFTRRIEEDRREDKLGSSSMPASPYPKDSTGDNSIFKIDTSAAVVVAAAVDECSPDCSLRFEADVKTSTPVKDVTRGKDGDGDVGLSRSSANLDDVFQSFKDESSKSRDSSSGEVEVEEVGGIGVPHEVDRPASVADRELGLRRNEDAGYESRSSHLFSSGSNDTRAELFCDADELSSGILRDAIVDLSDSERRGNPVDGGRINAPVVVAVVQRTISEESLPREMLVDQLVDDDEDDQQQHQQPADDDQKLAKDASNQITRQTSTNEGDKLMTPPPSSELKSNHVPSSVKDIVDEPEDDSQKSKKTAQQQQQQQSESTEEVDAKKSVVGVGGSDEGNPASMTPSLMELEAALTDMLEKKDEQEREEAEDEDEEKKGKDEPVRVDDKSSDKSPEPQIVPVKRNRPSEDVGDLRKVSQPKKEQQRQADDQSSPKSRIIDFPRVDRMNPFNDLKNDELDLNSSIDDPPEKPSRLHRVSLIEESVIEEPLIVPTPPRRRHRSKSNLNSSNESAVALHTYATNDRLI